MKRDTSRRQFLRQTGGRVALASAALVWPESAAAEATSPATSPRLGVGQIGVGHPHAAGKMSVLRGSSDWEVVGVVESDPELRRDAESSEIYRGLKWMTEEEMLDTPGLAAVAVETRVARSLDVAQRCVAAGKHIHLDKPPGSNFTQFRQLLKTADRQRLTVQLGYMYRYNPAVVLLRDLLDKGWLGDVFEVHAVMSKEVGESKRLRWTKNPGGSMFELGCHLIDLVVGVLGRPETVTPYNLHSGNFDDGLLDNMLAVCSYPRATATIKSTALEVEGFDRRHFVVCGTEGTLHIQPLDKPRVRLALSKRRGQYERGYQQVDVGGYERYVADLADLASIIRGEKESDFDTAHDLAVQETLLKACGLQLG